MAPIENAQNPEVIWDSVKDYCEDIITVRDANLNYIACNKAFLNLINKEESEVIGKSVYQLLPEENAKVIDTNTKMVLQDGGSRTFIFEIGGNLENKKIIRQTSTLVKKNGVITGVLSIARDVTVEENLKNQLLDSHLKFNTLLEHIPMIIYMKDSQGNYLASSKYAQSFIYNNKDPYIGYEKIELSETNDVIRKEDIKVIQSKEFLVKEKIATDLKGIEHWYRVIKAPVISDRERNDRLITIVQNIDIEKQDKVQQELFLAELTHDMKNPILAQISSMELLLNGVFGDLTPEQKEIVRITVESSKYMKELLYSILNSYKYDKGALKLDYNVFEVDLLVKDCMNEAFALAKEKNIELVYNSTLSEKENNLLADKRHLRIVISNMINNGISYGYSDSDYTITTERKGDNIAFHFENRSPEIPEEIKKHIFDKYVTGAKKYKKIGFGLGLYISKKIVDEHNGLIYITTKGDKTTFTVEIPITPNL